MKPWAAGDYKHICFAKGKKPLKKTSTTKNTCNVGLALFAAQLFLFIYLPDK